MSNEQLGSRNSASLPSNTILLPTSASMGLSGNGGPAAPILTEGSAGGPPGEGPPKEGGGKEGEGGPPPPPGGKEGEGGKKEEKKPSKKVDPKDIMKKRRERAICIDKVSRVVFPSTFILLNIMYWLIFGDILETIKDETGLGSGDGH